MLINLASADPVLNGLITVDLSSVSFASVDLTNVDLLPNNLSSVDREPFDLR